MTAPASIIWDNNRTEVMVKAVELFGDGTVAMITARNEQRAIHLYFGPTEALHLIEAITTALRTNLADQKGTE